MSRRINLIEVIKYCEVRFSRGDSLQWAHSDYSDLNKEIFSDTGINISVNTLKRIFGKLAVDESYIPQQATIEALKKYGRYIDPKTTPTIIEESPVEDENAENATRNLNPYIITVGALVIVGIVLWWFLQPSPVLVGQIKLKKTEGILPSTAVFDMQLPETNDSLFVNFGDKSSPVYVNKDQKVVTHNYLFSGVFRVTLLAMQTVVAETTVSINSNRWIALCYNDQLRSHYYEIPAIKASADSGFNLDNIQLHRMGLDTAQRIFTRLYNYTPVNYSEDEFVFETTFKNPPRKDGISCNSTQFQISGIKGMIRFKLSSPGCTSRVINFLSEKRYDGDKDDLSQFVVNQEEWNTIKIINKKKNVSLLVNGRLLFTGNYEKPLGEIKGLFIEFEGNGFVHSCDLETGDGTNLYHF